jgi:hypothetical protein
VYTIRFNNGQEIEQGLIQMYLEERLAKSSFRATIRRTIDKYGKYCLEVKPVRLRKAKPYCGNHPGECPIGGGKKPNATYLEWNDWIKFHKLVNAVLNKHCSNADVWSTPADVRGKMWIRKDNKPRKNWDWTEDYSSGRMIRVWNQGTPDQFEKRA